MKFYPYIKGQRIFFRLTADGGWGHMSSFRVVLIQEHKVLAILKGNAKGLHPLG